MFVGVDDCPGRLSVDTHKALPKKLVWVRPRPLPRPT